MGVLGGAAVLRREVWDGLPADVQKSMLDLVTEIRRQRMPEVREQDDATYTRLIEHGHKPVRLKGIDDWLNAGEQARLHLVGRMYTKKLLDKAEAIVRRYPE